MKLFKKLALIALILLILFCMISCSGSKALLPKGKNPLSDKKTALDGKITKVPEPETDSSSEKSGGESDGQTDAEYADSDESLQQNENSTCLPDSFPEDEVPLLADAVITEASTYEGNGGYYVEYTTKKSREDAIEFYRNILKSYKRFEGNEEVNFYHFFAETRLYYMDIFISKESVKPTQVLLNVFPVKD